MLKVATFKGVTDDGEPLVRVFHPGDSLVKTAGEMMPEVREWMSSYTPDPGKIAVLVNALGASEYWGQNVNGDIFPESALLHDCQKHSDAHPFDDFTGKILPPFGYWTFLQAYPFVHHRNKDPARAFGKVVLACWNPRMHRVELIILLDKQLAMQHGAQHVIDRILAGEFPDVSMGCRVPYDVCSICDHKSKTRKDYCNCVKLIGMNTVLDDGRKIGVINLHPRFFDISFVFIGADKTAKVMCKLGSVAAPQSVLDAEEIYGVPNEDDDDGLVKAASTRVQIPSNFYIRKPKDVGMVRQFLNLTPTTRLVRDLIKTPTSTKLGEAGQGGGAGIGGVDLAADDIAKGPPDPNDAKLMMSKEDKQENEERRAVSDGAVRTNADVNETDEFPQPLYPYNSGAQTKVGAKISELEHYGSMKRVWDAAKRMRIGPPPKPNRKKFPFTGSIDFRGLMIHVENNPGSVREGKGWKTNMRIAYGEFQGTRGVDKDKLDVYVGPYRRAPNVYIIHQNFVRGPKKGKYDEDKVMVGFESGDQAKQAYLAHYDSPKYFRSITTMAFPLFKRAIMKKEVHGEKVASDLTPMEKTAIDLKLEDLFNSSKTAERRQRTWKHSDGRMTKSLGSGMDDWDHVKTASWSSKELRRGSEKFNNLSTEEQEKIRREGRESTEKAKSQSTLLPDHHRDLVGNQLKVASPLEPLELLRVSNDPKMASQLKWADIVKEIGPSKAVGKVSPLLSDSEPELPKETLNEMGSGGLGEGLSTSSLAGMVLKPQEFQRACLCSMGKSGLADKLDNAGAVFKPTDQEEAPCGPLSSDQMGSGLMSKLLPHLMGKSYFGPPVRQRIIRITISKPDPQPAPTQVDSPLLSKVSAAYNWYRREQMKLAAEAPKILSEIPELHAAIYGMDTEDLFGKTAADLVNTKALAAILSAVPLTLMYSAHLRGKQRRGDKDMGFIKNMIADHPWLSTVASSAAMTAVMKTPQAQQALTEVLNAGGRIVRAGASAAV